MTGHIKAPQMAQYAEDARKSETPWKLWEEKQPHKCWVDCAFHPDWHDDTAYRRKPKTSRERFEEWAIPHNFGVAKHGNGEYVGSMTYDAWAAWQEAERQARELDE